MPCGARSPLTPPNRLSHKISPTLRLSKRQQQQDTQYGTSSYSPWPNQLERRETHSRPERLGTDTPGYSAGPKPRAALERHSLRRALQQQQCTHAADNRKCVSSGKHCPLSGQFAGDSFGPLGGESVRGNGRTRTRILCPLLGSAPSLRRRRR